MLLCEVLPREKRGFGMYAYNLCMAAGFLLSAVANMLLHTPPWGWRVSVALLAAPALGLTALLPSISESPQVLLLHGQPHAAVLVSGSSSLECLCGRLQSQRLGMLSSHGCSAAWLPQQCCLRQGVYAQAHMCSPPQQSLSLTLP